MENDNQMDLISQIISRISVKDLMRFTCVSKSWCSLIYNDLTFHRLHFQRTASAHRPFLFIAQSNYSETEDSPNRSFHNYLIDLDSIDDPNVNIIEIPDPFDEGNASIIGSCHGMFVLRQDPSLRMVVSNPTIKKHHPVPPNPAGDDNIDFLGFGYDNVHDRYKLVTIIKPEQSRDHIDTLMIYDFKDGAWRKCLFDDLGYNDYFSCLHYYPAVYVDGALYYYVDFETSEVMTIMCLDLAKEEFHVLECPRLDEAVTDPVMTVFDGRLCLSCMLPYTVCRVLEGQECACDLGLNNYITEFWMMEGSSYRPRWTKFLSIPNLDFYGLVGEPSAPPTPLCFSGCRNKMLIAIDGILFWYDLKEEEFVELDHLTTRLGRYFDTIECCVRSLVS